MELYPFTPDGPPTWAVVPIIVAAIVAVPLVVLGIGGYIVEMLAKKPPRDVDVDLSP